MKIKFEHIIEDSIAIAIALAAAGAVFEIGNKFFGLFGYNGLSSAQIGQTQKNILSHFKVLSSVNGRSIWGRDYTRGVLAGSGGSLYYYRFEFQNGAPAGIQLYPLTFESWSTSPAVFDSATLI